MPTKIGRGARWLVRLIELQTAGGLDLEQEAEPRGYTTNRGLMEGVGVARIRCASPRSQREGHLDG